MKKKSDIQNMLSQAVLQQSFRSLAKLLTILESEAVKDQPLKEEILNFVCVQKKKINPAPIISFSGPPGVGKSTLMESLCSYLLSKNKKICVLAIDPSSPLTGGSLMGDRTRMVTISSHENCFIRPSPNRGNLGGIAKATKYCADLCQVAGFDYIFIETVGVGQSEIEVKYISDLFILLLQPGSGDDLQGVKKGILELCDMIVVTKFDGDLKNLSKKTAQDMKVALHSSLTPKNCPILNISSKENYGIKELAHQIDDFYSSKIKSKNFSKEKKQKDFYWLKEELKDEVLRQILYNDKTQNIIEKEYTKTLTTSTLTLAKNLSKKILKR